MQGGARWSDRHDYQDPGLAVYGGRRFDVSGRGDVALVADRFLNTPGSPDASTMFSAVEVSYDDLGMNRRLVGRGSPIRPSQITDPERAVVVAASESFNVISRGLRELKVTSLFGQQARDFSFASAEGGVLSGESDGRDGVSLDLGQSWLLVPNVPDAELTSGVTRHGSWLTRLWYGDSKASGSPADAVTHVQTSSDNGRSWTTHAVDAPDTQAVRQVVPLADGTFAGTTADGTFLSSPNGAAFTPTTGPRGQITSMGGHNGQAWAVTNTGQLWLWNMSQGE